MSSEHLSIDHLNLCMEQYERLLVSKLKTPLYKFFVKVYDDARDEAKTLIAQHYKVDKTDVSFSNVHKQFQTLDLRCFQNTLRQIPQWNQDAIAAKTKEIVDSLKNPFPLRDVLKILFVGKATVLAAIRASSERVQVPVPTVEAYMHRVLFHIARELFENPELMRNCRGKYIDADIHLDAQRHVNRIVSHAIRNAIPDLLPVETILEAYLRPTLQSYDYKRPAAAASPASGEAPATTAAADKEEEYKAPVMDEFGFSTKDAETSDEDDDDEEEYTESGSEYESATEDEEEEVSAESDVDDRHKHHHESDVDDHHKHHHAPPLPRGKQPSTRYFEAETKKPEVAAITKPNDKIREIKIKRK